MRIFCLFIILLLWGCSLDVKPINSAKKVKIDKVAKNKPSTPKSIISKRPTPEPEPIVNTQIIQNYCYKIDRYFRKYNWGSSHCDKYQWNHVRSSFWGNPIIWHVFGDEEGHKREPKNMTLILCGVHGDEITPIKFCFDILEDLTARPELTRDKLIVVAPIVTPDSFMRSTPTRTNARGVDINRNLPTRDWSKSALSLWKKRYKSDKRRFPGLKSMSEQETIFQVNIIKRYKPNKILSVHAPLTLIDYDGPGADHANGGAQLLIQMSDKAGKYKINNYPFFTGSLGNWAGNERNIPTYTIELPDSDWTKTKKYYDMLKPAIHHAISHDIKVSNQKKSPSSQRDN